MITRCRFHRLVRVFALCSCLGHTSAAFSQGGGDRVELLGQPCRSLNMLAARVVPDPKSGRDLFVLTNMNEAGAELILIDYEQDKGKIVRAPAGEGAWALAEIPGSRLAMGTFFDATFAIYDLRTDDWVTTARVSGEQYLWSFALGSDGRLYGGTYNGGKLAALDLSTYAVEDLGAPARPNLYLRNVSALPDGRIFCHFGMENPTSLVFDPKTKAFAPVPERIKNVKGGVSWGPYFLTDNRVFDGASLGEVTPPPFPPPAGAEKWSVNMDLTTSDTLYLHAGSRLFRLRTGEAAPVPVSEAGLGKVRVAGVSRRGELLGRRGQDYFVVRPGEKEVALRRVPVQSAPRPTLFLRQDERGHLWGGPWFGQTLFVMNPETGETTNTGVVTASGGEVYDIASLGGKIYAASYSGGEIIEYDPAQPWEEFTGRNPRTITKLEGKGYIRPAAGISVGPDGKLYSGWWGKYGVYGGAIAVTDPGTRKTELIEDPLGRQSVGGLAVDDKWAYVATTVMANGLPNKPEAPKFGVLDLETRQLVYEHTFSSWNDKTTTQSTPLALDRQAGRVALSADGKLHLFDTVAQRFVEPGPIRTAPSVDTFVIAAPGNGLAYYGSGRSVVEVDLRSGQHRVAAELPRSIWTLCAAPDGTVYAACGVDVYRVRTK